MERERPIFEGSFAVRFLEPDGTTRAATEERDRPYWDAHKKLIAAALAEEEQDPHRGSGWRVVPR